MYRIPVSAGEPVIDDQFNFLYKREGDTEWQEHEPTTNDIAVVDGAVTIKAAGFKAQSWFADVREVKLPNKWYNGSADVDVTSIGVKAFYLRRNLTSMIIPDGIMSIGNDAFNGCNGLMNVTIPDSVTSIGDGAFNQCTKLTSVTIGSGVTNIGRYAFFYCENLMSFVVNANNANYKSENGLLLSKDGKTLINGINGDVVIPDSVTTIQNAAFFGRRNLTNVTIPDSVTHIEYNAFCGCSSLTSIVIPDSVTNIESEILRDCGNLVEITVPFVGSSRGNTGSADSVFGYIFGN